MQPAKNIIDITRVFIMIWYNYSFEFILVATHIGLL